jgi:hypothetical protein
MKQDHDKVYRECDWLALLLQYGSYGRAVLKHRNEGELTINKCFKCYMIFKVCFVRFLL